MRMMDLFFIAVAIGMLAVFCWGCAHVKNATANPYDAGRAGGTAYLIAENTAPAEYVRGAELAYDALAVIVDSPAEPTPERLKQVIYSLADEHGYNQTLVDNALEAVRIFRDYIDPYLRKADGIQETLNYLQDFKRGIDDVVRKQKTDTH